MHSFVIRLTVCVAAFAAAGAAPFDKPIDKKVIALPADPANPQAKPNRTCWYYAGFTVKQVDLGEKGADELAIAPIAASACPAKIAGEVIIKSDDWAGYFLGVKGPFVFFNSDDGLNGGLPFAVFAPTGKKLFEDSRDGEHFTALQIENGDLVLHYRRAYDVRCSMAANPAACWRRVTKDTALPEAARFDCEKTFKTAIDQQKIPAAALPGLATMIGYAVEARYANGKVRYTPRAGAVTCWLES